MSLPVQATPTDSDGTARIHQSLTLPAARPLKDVPLVFELAIQSSATGTPELTLQMEWPLLGLLALSPPAPTTYQEWVLSKSNRLPGIQVGA